MVEVLNSKSLGNDKLNLISYTIGAPSPVEEKIRVRQILALERPDGSIVEPQISDDYRQATILVYQQATTNFMDEPTSDSASKHISEDDMGRLFFRITNYQDFTKVRSYLNKLALSSDNSGLEAFLASL